MEPALHLLFKCKADSIGESVARHREIAQRRGFVWWGNADDPCGSALRSEAIQRIQAQLHRGAETCVYLYGPSELWRTTLRQITTDASLVDEWDRPSYYSRGGCNLFVRLSDFSPLRSGWESEHLALLDDPRPAKLAEALCSRANPLVIVERGRAATRAGSEGDQDAATLASDTARQCDDSSTNGTAPPPRSSNAAATTRSAEPGPPSVEPFSVDDAEAVLFPPRARLEEMLSYLTSRKNLVLEGASGVGKTFIAQQLAWCLAGARDASRTAMVQLHDSFAYGDFVRGLRPSESGSLQLEDGVFLEFCERAKRDSHRRYVFIIDEVQNGDLGGVMGDLAVLIDGEKRGPAWEIALSCHRSPRERFSMPENLHLIAVWNTAHRSTRAIDLPLRRRFAFHQLQPEFDNPRFQAHLVNRGLTAERVTDIVRSMRQLNESIAADKDLGAGFAIGHGFFCPPGSGLAETEVDGWHRCVIASQIVPLLEAYWGRSARATTEWRKKLGA